MFTSLVRSMEVAIYRGRTPLFENCPPPPLRQSAQEGDLKHKQQQSDNCCSKKGMHLFKGVLLKHWIGTVSWEVGGGGVTNGFPFFSKNSV